MGTNCRANNVMSGVQFYDPGSHGFVDSITKCARPCFDGDDLSTEELNSEDVEGLSSYIFLLECQVSKFSDVRGRTHSSHIDSAFHSEFCANSGSSNTVLAGTSFGDNFSLA